MRSLHHLKQLIAKLVNIAIDNLTGFSINKESKKARAFDFLTRGQIIDYQNKKFRELSSIASKSVYYKGLANKPLDEFPMMDRETYTLNIENLQTNYSKPYFVRKSSGSTGTPVPQFVTKEMLLAKRVSHQKTLAWYGLRRESAEFKLGGLPVDFKTKLYYWFKNKRYVSSYQISPKSISKIARSYNRMQPEIMYGYPSAIFNFITNAKNMGIDLHHPKIIVTHAENLYREIEEKYREIFPQSEIVNQYWATEANIAETCPKGKLHIDEDTVICEVINPDKGGVGALHITNLFSNCVPLIRYKIGDRVKITDEPCECGRNTKIIESLEGRDIEIIELQNGTKFPVTAIYIAKFSTNMESYQLVFYKSVGKIELRYIPIKKGKPIEEENIRHYIAVKFGLVTEFKALDQLELSAGGKFKKLIIRD